MIEITKRRDIKWHNIQSSWNKVIHVDWSRTELQLRQYWDVYIAFQKLHNAHIKSGQQPCWWRLSNLLIIMHIRNSHLPTSGAATSLTNEANWSLSLYTSSTVSVPRMALQIWVMDCLLILNHKFSWFPFEISQDTKLSHLLLINI